MAQELKIGKLIFSKWERGVTKSLVGNDFSTGFSDEWIRNNIDKDNCNNYYAGKEASVKFVRYDKNGVVNYSIYFHGKLHFAQNIFANKFGGDTKITFDSVEVAKNTIDNFLLRLNGLMVFY